MIGASVIGNLFGRAPEPAPDPGPAAAPAGTFALSVTELRCALALFDVADELDQLRQTNDYVMPERERMAHAYAAWMLVRAARRLAEAHASDEAAEARP